MATNEAAAQGAANRLANAKMRLQELADKCGEIALYGLNTGVIIGEDREKQLSDAMNSALEQLLRATEEWERATGVVVPK